MEGSGLILVETRSEARYYQGSSGPALIYYRRETTDGRYWGQLEGGRVWTGYPGHDGDPNEGAVYGDAQLAKRSIDHFIDVMVPTMIMEARREPLELQTLPVRPREEPCPKSRPRRRRASPSDGPQGVAPGTGSGESLPPGV